MSVDAFAERLSDSSSTVRHELAPLGQVRRTYGGAALAGHSLEHMSTVKGRGALAEKNAIRRARRRAPPSDHRWTLTP